jgi:hypothetical protein
MQDAPNLTSDYEMKREYVPLTERVNVEDFDEVLDERRKLHQSIDKEVEEIENCTFEPKTLQKGKMTRSIDDLYLWNDMKNRKREFTQLKQVVDMPQYRFKPRIDSNSVEILERKKEQYLSTKPEDRLMEVGEKLSEKKQLMRESSTKGWFKPQLTRRSKEIVARKNGKLPAKRKTQLKKTGRSKNVTYYDASIRPSTGGNQQAATK